MKSACKYSILYLSNFFVAWSSKLLVGFFFVWVVVGEGRVDMTLLLALILIAIVFENVNIWILNIKQIMSPWCAFIKQRLSTTRIWVVHAREISFTSSFIESEFNRPLRLQ